MIIAFMPCYNEAASIESAIYKTLENGVHWVIVSNDGSRDHSLAVLQGVAKNTGRVFVLNFLKNQGVATAKITGFALAWLLFRHGLIPADALLTKLDSDGQHDPRYILKMAAELKRRDLDFLLSYRDFSVYPRFKVIGNKAVSLVASALTGRFIRDSMSGLKIMKMSVVGEILSYFSGFRYAAAQEITMIPALTRRRFANDFPVDIPIYKSGSGIRDGISVLRMSLACWWRVLRKRRLDPDERSLAFLSHPNVRLVSYPPHLPLDGVLNISLATV